MAKLMKLSIDVTKITKSRLYKGKKGTYLDLVVELKDEVDQYNNNVAAWEGQTEEERKAKNDRNFLGNGKVIWESDKKEEAPAQEAPVDDDESLDLPF